MTEVVADEAGRTFVDDKTSEWAELGAVVARRLAQHQAVGRFEGLTEVDYTFTWFFPGLGSGLQMRVFFVNLLQPETEGEHLRHVGGRHCLDLGQELDRICGEVLHVVAPELFTTPFLFGRGPLLTTLGCTSALWCLISRPVVGGGAILLLLIRALDKLGGFGLLANLLGAPDSRNGGGRRDITFLMEVRERDFEVRCSPLATCP